ncbi:SusD/RagB family nutrient-binding outer membrane lipoprotein [candidate division KSB1 bacterium]|nr:SusD/RagB family nutrient-binding outer membrane lipoprotein [candidate division KSB1 bacterium]
MAGIEGKFNITLTRYSDTGLTGEQVLEAIMMEKYIAMFLNMVVWSDWKRTDYPVFTTIYSDRPVPRRFLYSMQERNSNIPSPSTVGTYTRNENDPN